MTHATLEDIVNGSRAVHEIERDANHVAFLANRPVRPGHTVVVTSRAADSVADLTEAEHAALWQFVHRLSRRMRQQLPCERVCVQVIGWAVRHAHVHLIPTDAPDQVAGLDGEPLSRAEMEAMALRLRANGVG